MRAGVRVWEKLDAAHLTMRPFDRDFAQRYVATIGDAATASVGAYQLEGLGAQLFHRVQGDHWTIMGMPILPVLAALRQAGVLAS